MNFADVPWRVRYAALGAMVVPLFGRLALTGTGHEHDLYRYMVPLLVGSVAGFFIGRFKDKLLSQNARLRLEAQRSARLASDLKANEEYLRAILDNAPLPIYLKESDELTYLLVNRRAEEVAGLPAEKIIGRNDFELTTDESARMLREQDRQIIESDAPLMFETDIRLHGRQFYFLTCKFPLHDENGNIYAVGGVCMDITKRKEAEKRLAEQEERLSVTLRNIGDGVISTDTRGRVVFINAVAERLTGWTQSEAAGRLLEDIMQMQGAADGKTIPSPVEAIIAGDRPMNLSMEIVLVARDGTRRFIEDSCAPIHDRESRIIGVVLVFRDVTRQRQMEKELLKTRKLESVGVLAGGIAHDFNNILVAILGNINLASLLIGPDHEAAELLQNAETASKRARDLTRQLLTFSKGGTPVKRVAHLPELIRETADLLMHGSNTAIKYHMSEDTWMVEMDTGQMGQVIQNLVINSMHAMPDGGVIEIACENVMADDNDNEPLYCGLAPGRYVRLTVRDHGIGIPESILDRVFDPYFSTKQEGSGLGLAIVHSIVSKHGGHIAVESEPGSGTVFTIMLPAAGEERQADQQREDQTHISSGKGTVLVMDDDEMVRDIASQMLAHLGYSVLSAGDGDEAIKIYRKYREQGRPIAAVIMDLTVPGGMGGRECAARLLEYDPDARCIVSSGYSNDDVMADFRQYGFRASLIKPFNIAEMGKTLAHVLNRDGSEVS